jgi:hypothetical protein
MLNILGSAKMPHLTIVIFEDQNECKKMIHYSRQINIGDRKSPMHPTNHVGGTNFITQLSTV